MNFARVSNYIDIAREIIIKLVESKSIFCKWKVYLNTAKMTPFGKLSGMTRSDLSNSRFDISQGKRYPNDILLWNTSYEVGEKYYVIVVGSGYLGSVLRILQ